MALKTKASYQICTRHQLVRFARFGDFSLDQIEEIERELIVVVVQDRVQMSGRQKLIQKLEHRKCDSINLN